MKSCFIVTILILPLGLLAQVDRDVPHTVKIHFMEDYISASDVTWDKKENDRYAANFFHQSLTKRATYSNEGRLLLLETTLTSLAQVPPAVAETVTKRYKFYVVEQIWKTETEHEVILNFLIRKQEKIYELRFLPSGKLKNKISR